MQPLASSADAADLRARLHLDLPKEEAADCFMDAFTNFLGLS